MENKKVAALKWDKYIMVQRETDYLANYLVSDKSKNYLIGMGKPTISPWMRGHVRMPMSKVVKKLVYKQDKFKNLRLVFVDEFNTTQLCSKCNAQMKIIKKSRTAYCSCCGTAWDRDVNAGRNILHLALVKIGIINKEQLPYWEYFRAIANLEDWPSASSSPSSIR